MNQALIQAVIDAADQLIAAHDSTTGQFEPEVARLSAAVSALERALTWDARHSFHQNLAALSASLHTHGPYARFYEGLADRLSGFVGIHDLCITMADVLTAWETRNGGPLAYEALAVGWIEVVDDFVDNVLQQAISAGNIPDLEKTGLQQNLWVASGSGS